MRSSIAFLLFTGCFGGEVADFGCPVGETCSPETPNGLHFFGADLAGNLELDNERTAVGGIQRVRLAKEVGDTFVDLTSGYLASTNGPAIEVEGHEGAVVSLLGTAAGQNHLEIRDANDNSLMDRKVFAAAELATVGVVSPLLESSDLPIAFLAGSIRFGIGLEDSEGHRLVDEGMTLDATGSTFVSWDTFELSAAPGTTAMIVTAGDKAPFTVDLVAVATVEEIVDNVQPSEPLVAGSTGVVCFEARSTGHYVAGLTWAFTTNNGDVQEFLSPGCVSVAPATAGEIQIVATAGGVEKSVVYPVAAPQAKPRRVHPMRASGGERATAAATSSR